MGLGPAFDDVLDDALKRHGLQEYHTEIARHAKRTFLLRLCAVEDGEEVPVGASKFGGRPDLPPDYAWPRCEDGFLEFIGQINLSELPDVPHALPTSGLLSLFADSEGPFPCALNWFDLGLVEPRPQPPEEEMPDPGAWDVDPDSSLLITEFVPSVSLARMGQFEGLIDEDEEDEFYDRFGELMEDLRTLDDGTTNPTSRLLGHALDSYGESDGEDEQVWCVESTIVDGRWRMSFWDAGSLHVISSSMEWSEGPIDASAYILST